MIDRGRRDGRFGGGRGGFGRFTRVSEAVNGNLSPVPGVVEFIRALTGVDNATIEKFINEITSNRKFEDLMEKNRDGRYRGFYGIGPVLGELIYALCRIVEPDTFVETGVSSGISSSYILCALEENGKGALYSIDLPWWDEDSGWIIPGYLKHRWHLELGSSSEKLPPLLEKLGKIDVFMHDSEHTYRNMLWEYETAWKYMSEKGILLSHNISHSRAFPDFCHKMGVKGYIFGDMGGTVKK